jgi:hypothetical protein
MTNLVETRHTGEYLISEAEGTLSREQVVVTQSGAAILSGTLMGKITASGKYIPYLDGAVDGSQACAGILYSHLPAATGDIKAVLHVRLAEVATADLTGVDANGTADLKALNIILR